jgi:hypothetical protein
MRLHVCLEIPVWHPLAQQALLSRDSRNTEEWYNIWVAKALPSNGLVIEMLDILIE